MATFYVGQRVRLVRDCAAWNVGLEGRIVAFFYAPKGTLCIDGKRTLFDCDCEVTYETTDVVRFESTSRIEPILPEGHKPSEYTYTELMDRLRSGVVA